MGPRDSSFSDYEIFAWLHNFSLLVNMKVCFLINFYTTAPSATQYSRASLFVAIYFTLGVLVLNHCNT
jgi:hypothetical protein